MSYKHDMCGEVKGAGMTQVGEEERKGSLAGGWRPAVLCLCLRGEMGLDRRQN